MKKSRGPEKLSQREIQRRSHASGGFQIGDTVRHRPTGDVGRVSQIESNGRIWVSYNRMGFGTGSRSEFRKLTIKGKAADFELIETKASVHINRGESINLRTQQVEGRHVNLPGGTRKRRRAAQAVEPEAHGGHSGRVVRTEAGARRYGVPIGTPITAEMIRKAASGWQKPNPEPPEKTPPHSEPPKLRSSAPAANVIPFGTGRYGAAGGLGFSSTEIPQRTHGPVNSRTTSVTATPNGKGGVVVRQHTVLGDVVTQHPKLTSAIMHLQEIFAKHPEIHPGALIHLQSLSAEQPHPPLNPPQRRVTLRG